MHVSPRLTLDIIVWISYILPPPHTSLELYQSPSQATSWEPSLQEQHKEVLSWTTVPEEPLTCLKDNSGWIWSPSICRVPRGKRLIVCAIDYRLKLSEFLSCKPWKKRLPLLISLYVCCMCLLWTSAKVSSHEDWFFSPSPYSTPIT